MEDNSNYTYTYEKEEEAKPERSLKFIFAGVIVALAVLAIALGIFFGVRSATEPETTEPETTTEVVTTEAAPQSPYNKGKYSVNTEGRALFSARIIPKMPIPFWKSTTRPSLILLKSSTMKRRKLTIICTGAKPLTRGIPVGSP